MNATSTLTGDVQYLPVSALSAHPDNPRVSMREDVVEGIRSQLIKARELSVEHALLVRPIEEGYQLVSGHHRLEAARRAGLHEVPCWVRELSDEEAFLRLVLENSQAELTPLERGIHALSAAGRSVGGRGRKGGIAAYAERVGMAKQYLGELRDGAEVYLGVKPSSRDDSLRSKAKHLALVKRVDRSLWPLCVEALVRNDWSLDETRKWVERVAAFEIPEAWQDIFLPYPMVVETVLSGRELSPKTIAALVKAAEATVAAIEAEADAPSVDRERVKSEFIDWLRGGVGEESWNLRAVSAKQREFMNELRSSAQAVSDSWLLGDWREHVEMLANESVELLLTDPPFGINLAGANRRHQRRGEESPRIQNDGHENAMDEISAMLEAFEPKLCSDSHLLLFCHWRREPEVREVLANAGFNLQSLIVWAKDNHGVGDLQRAFAPKHELVLYATKGDPRLSHREPDVIEAPRVSSERHPTEKPCALLERLIKAVTVEGDLVADPFGGVASTLVAARDCERRYWGCEIEENYHQIGQRRLRS